jgi:hypothetical protein
MNKTVFPLHPKIVHLNGLPLMRTPVPVLNSNAAFSRVTAWTEGNFLKPAALSPNSFCERSQAIGTDCRAVPHGRTRTRNRAVY